MNTPLFELEESFQCVCFDSVRYCHLNQPSPSTTSKQQNSTQYFRRSGKSHDKNNEKNINPKDKGRMQKTSLRRSKAFSNYEKINKSETSECEILKGGLKNFEKIADNLNINNCQSFNNAHSSRNSQKNTNFQRFDKKQMQREAKNKEAYIHHSSKFKTYQPISFTQDIYQKQVPFARSNLQIKQLKQSQPLKYIFQPHKIKQLGNFRFPEQFYDYSEREKRLHSEDNQISINLQKNNQQGRVILSQKVQSFKNSKISLTNRDSKFSHGTQKLSKLNSHRSSKAKNESENMIVLEQEMQSFKIYMKQIESVDDNDFDEQMSQVIGQGWDVYRDREIDELNKENKDQKLMTLPTSASNMKNSQTQIVTFGTNSYSMKRT